MQRIYSHVVVALLAISATTGMLPAATAQTTLPGAACNSTADNCLFMPLLRRDALPVRSIEPIATLPGSATYAVADNGYAYVGLDNTLSVVDVHTPAQPHVVGRYPLVFESLRRVSGIVQQGARIYVATYYRPTSCCFVGDLLIFDVQQPNTPTLLGKAETGGLRDLAVRNQLVFVTGIPWAFLTLGLAVYDVSNPAIPTQLSSLGRFGTDYGNDSVAVTDNTAYVGNRESIRVFDISDPVTSTLQTTKAFSDVYDLVVDGRFLYAAAGTNGIAVFDISVPDEPVLVGQVATGGNATQLQVVDGRAFVAQGEDGVAVVDVVQPSDPQLLASYKTPGPAVSVWGAGNMMYGAEGEAGLQILRLVP